MTLTELKKDVTRYFKARKAQLSQLTKARMPAKSDFFELYVLQQIAKASGAAMCQTGNRNGKSVFCVACSPNPSWSKASYFKVCDGYGARTGLQVTCSGPGTVELDVVIVKLAAVHGDKVSHAGAFAAYECKAHARRLTLSHANEVIGKAGRVWALPVKELGVAPGPPYRYCAVALNGTDPMVPSVLEHQNIGCCDAPSSALDDIVEQMLEAVKAAEP